MQCSSAEATTARKQVQQCPPNKQPSSPVAPQLHSDASHESTLSPVSLFFTSLAVLELLGAAAIAVCVWWMSGQKGGFDLWSSTTRSHAIFNYHPPLMTVAMIVLNANGILVYRTTRSMRYRRQKTIHLSVQTAMIVTAWLGVAGAWWAHARTHRAVPHLYSLHSWLGIVGLCGVSTSLVTSFATFLYPKAGPIYRRLSLPFHVFGGIVNLALSAVVCITGITEFALFSLKNNVTGELLYTQLPPVAIVLNTFGVIIVVFTTLAIWLVTKPEFKPKYKLTVNTSNFVLKRENTIE